MKIGRPTDAQVLRMRSEIVGCLERHAAEGKTGTAQGWFRSKWVSQPFFKDAIAKAAHEAPSTGNSVADTNARRTAMMFGGVQ